MRVTGLSHIPIQVRDVEQSLRFYRDFLGMDVSLDLEEIHERHDIHRRGVYLRWESDPRGPFVVLGQALGAPAPGSPATLGHAGVDHIAFEVDDVQAFIDKAEAMGVRRLGRPGPPGLQAPEAYGATGPGHVQSVMFCDPDGVVVQLDAWCEGPAETTGVHRPWTAVAVE
jgi:catechol 2,3-dioxygenase-like lactoylglutathione lyase family enzyme